MRLIKVGGLLLLAADLAIRGGTFHLDVPGYRGEPMPANPFSVVATATAQPVFLTGNIYLNRTPLE
jgi:hypothetical protein